jgi:hypothetical protein
MRRRSANSNACARVSRDEDERARGILAKRTVVLAKRSQAGGCVLGPSEAPTCGCTKRPPASFHCFRIVIYNDFCNSHVSAALSVQDLPRQHSRRRAHGAAVTFELVVHPSRTARRRRLIERPSEPRRPDSAPFFVRQPFVARFVPTDACDEVCATAAMPTQIIARGCAQQLYIPGGRLASIVAAGAKSYDSGVT